MGSSSTRETQRRAASASAGAIAALLLVWGTACSARCPDDERVHMRPGLTQADVCEQNGRRVAVRFAEDQTVEAVQALVEARGWSLPCDDVEALAGEPGKSCWIVQLDEPTCCGEGIAYFTSDATPRASAEVVHPDTPCSCATDWTAQ